MNLNLRPKEECQFDAVSLGEVMLRLDPGEGRIRTARNSVHGKAAESTTLPRTRRCFGIGRLQLSQHLLITKLAN